jgi:transcription elongation factor Elf1
MNVRWKCSLCGEVCANLAVHVGRNHADQEFQCGQCQVQVGSEYLLKVHEKTHIAEALPCNICGKVVKVSAWRSRS